MLNFKMSRFVKLMKEHIFAAIDNTCLCMTCVFL